MHSQKLSAQPQSFKVLHVVPRWNHGGATTSILMEAKIARATASGIVHQALALEPGGSLRQVKEAIRFGVRLRPAPSEEDERDLIHAADVVVLHYWNTPSVWSFLDRWRDKPLQWILYSRVNGMHRPQRLPRSLASAACHVVLTSPHLQSSLGHERVTVLPAIARLPDAPAKSWTPGSSHVVHAGTLNVFKLSPHFVPLHAGVSDPDHPMIVAGSGGDERRFQAEAESMGAAREFRWVGFSFGLPGLFDGARILSHPVSGFSYASSDKVIQESQAAGLPVLIQRNSPVAHLVREEVTGILADDLIDFRAKLQAITEGEYPLPARMKVREAALEDHDPERKSEILNSIYRDVRDGPARPINDGFGTLEAWLSYHVGDVDELAGARRPSLADLRTENVLEAHQRWACEGGLAQYLNVFPMLARGLDLQPL